MDLSSLNPFSPSSKVEEVKSHIDEKISPTKSNDHSKPIRSPDLEMDYDDKEHKEHKEHKKDKKDKKGPPTPASDPAGDLGGCILGLGNEFNKNLSDGLSFIFDSNSSNDNNSSNNHSDDKIPHVRKEHHEGSIVDSLIVDEQAWTSRPGTPDYSHPNGHHHK